MKTIIIKTHSCFKDEYSELKEYLENQSWDYKEENSLSCIISLSNEEKDELIGMINSIIGKRITNLTNLSYFQLIDLKNKLWNS